VPPRHRSGSRRKKLTTGILVTKQLQEMLFDVNASGPPLNLV
jgi:hypothetical protein